MLCSHETGQQKLQYVWCNFILIFNFFNWGKYLINMKSSFSFEREMSKRHGKVRFINRIISNFDLCMNFCEDKLVIYKVFSWRDKNVRWLLPFELYLPKMKLLLENVSQIFILNLNKMLKLNTKTHCACVDPRTLNLNGANMNVKRIICEIH